MPAKKSPEFETMHIPVLLTKEVLAVLHPRENGLYLDGTVGMGGHAKAFILDAARTASFCALDRILLLLNLQKQSCPIWGKS